MKKIQVRFKKAVLRKIVAAIKASPDTFNMAEWIRKAPSTRKKIIPGYHVCGATACIQGFGNIIQGMRYAVGTIETVVYRSQVKRYSDSLTLTYKFPLYFRYKWPEKYKEGCEDIAAINLLQDIIDDKAKLYFTLADDPDDVADYTWEIA